MSEIYLTDFAREFGFFRPWLEFQVKQADILPKYDDQDDVVLSESQLEFLMEHLQRIGYDIDEEAEN